jgi:hypothetical protein
VELQTLAAAEAVAVTVLTAVQVVKVSRLFITPILLQVQRVLQVALPLQIPAVLKNMYLQGTGVSPSNGLFCEVRPK